MTLLFFVDTSIISDFFEFLNYFDARNFKVNKALEYS